MSTVADAVLGYCQTLGFVKSWPGFVIATGLCQTLLDIFYPGPQDPTLTAIHKSEQEILDAIKAEGEAILSGVWDMFETQYLSAVTTAQQQFGTAFNGYRMLPANAISPVDDPDQTQTTIGNITTWKASVTEMTGAQSPLLNACNFVASQADKRNTSIHLYLLSATVYLNYCKLGLMLDYTLRAAGFPDEVAKYKAQHPQWQQDQKDLPTLPTTSADLTTNAYYGYLVGQLPNFLAYAQPIISDLTSHLAAKKAAVEKRARDYVLQGSGGQWYYVDERTGAKSAPTDKATATSGMLLEIGMAQDEERKTQDALYGLQGVDPTEVATAASSIAQLQRTQQDYPGATT